MSSGYEAVLDAFAENFSRRREVGAACCVYHHGEKVVDLWGGLQEQVDRRALGRGHDGAGLFRDQRLCGNDVSGRPFARLA